MKKILLSILGLLLLSSVTIAKADWEGMSQYPWQPMTVPMWCGPIDDVNMVLEREGYVAVEVAFGRGDASPDGELAYADTTYASKDTPGHIVRKIATPDQIDKCIMNMLFDYKRLEIKPSTNL